MKQTQHHAPPLLGLFQKRIAGDDALLELAKRRFQEMGMGAEFYAGNLAELEWIWQFNPGGAAPVVHLPRSFNVFEEDAKALVLRLAKHFAGKIRGFVVHDQWEIEDRKEDYVTSVGELNSRMKGISNCPLLFIEYAVGLEFEQFVDLHSRLSEMELIGPCIDIGHVGIWQARQSYSKLHPGEDVCDLKHSKTNMDCARLDDVEKAVRSALPAVLNLIVKMTRRGRPLHFHLHDGHPLSIFSPYGVSDHLSFFTSIPVEGAYKFDESVKPLFGREGLNEVVFTALSSPYADSISFTLEIHETDERLPLQNDVAPLFEHWQDKTNAEKMNRWLSVLQQNHRLLCEAVDRAKHTQSVSESESPRR